MMGIENDIFNLLSHAQTSRVEVGLAEFIRLLDRLEHPHLRVPPVIHVAGTNGKGSVLAYLDSILREVGFTVHRYTSPHLVSICERIQICGRNIAAEKFLATLETVVAQASGLSLTFFELITAVAFVEFAKNSADYLLLETGMGGRHDATNVIDNPIISIITQIGLDHVKELGPEITDIAREKAGIIKRGCPIVTLKQSPEVMQVISDEAKIKHAKLIVASPLNLKTGLLGEHQQLNAALAYEVASLLNIDKYVILKGLKQTTWPGRMQKITYGERNVWVDMAHNASAALAAAQSMRDLHTGKFHLIFSLRETKDLNGFLSAFKENLLSATYIPIKEYAAGHAIDDVMDCAINLGISLRVAESLYDSVRSLPNGPILITGSAILVGEALEDGDHTK